MDYNIDYNNVEKDRTLILQEKINRYLKNTLLGSRGAQESLSKSVATTFAVQFNIIQYLSNTLNNIV